MAYSGISRKHSHEKRRSPRIALESVTVEIYTAEGETATPRICDIINLSEGGMLFRCDRAYHIGQVLRLTFLVPDSMLAIRSNAVVIHEWVDLSGIYAGVRFAKLGVSEQASLQQYLRNQQSN